MMRMGPFGAPTSIMTVPAQMEVTVTAHALERLTSRFPQFARFPRRDQEKVIELIAYLGKKQGRISRWMKGKDNIYIRGDNIFGTGEDIIVIAKWSTTMQRYMAVTVYPMQYFIEAKRRKKRAKKTRRRYE